MLSICVAMVWLSQSLRFIKIIITNKVGISEFLRLVLHLLPELIAILLPVATFLSILIVYNKAAKEQELTILRLGGFSDFQLSKPARWLLCVVAVLTLSLSSYFAPLILRSFRQLQFDIAHKAPEQLIQPGEFIFFNNITVFVEQIYDNKSIRNILIFDATKPESKVTIISQKGYFLETKNGNRLVLLNGCRHEHSVGNNRYKVLSFKKYSLDLESAAFANIPHHTPKTNELFIWELWDKITHTQDPYQLANLYNHLHRVLMRPLYLFLLGALALAAVLKGDYQRRNPIKNLGLSVCCAIVSEATYYTVSYLSTNHHELIILGYFYPLLVFILIPLFSFINRSVKQK